MKNTSSFEKRHPEYSTTIKETEFAIKNLLRKNLQSQRAALAPLPDFRHLYERSRKAEEAARSPPHGAPRRAGQWTQGLSPVFVARTTLAAARLSSMAASSLSFSSFLSSLISSRKLLFSLLSWVFLFFAYKEKIVILTQLCFF